jgi:hypothetical protein
MSSEKAEEKPQDKAKEQGGTAKSAAPAEKPAAGEDDKTEAEQ